MRKMLALIASLLLLTLPALALGQTRALLVACHDFLSMPGLGNSVSGNLHIIGSALVGAGLNVGSLSRTAFRPHFSFPCCQPCDTDFLSDRNT